MAPVRVRDWKTSNGTSGAAARDSITTKATQQDDARARAAPIVCVEPQPGVVGVDERVDQDGEAGGDGDRAGDVEAAALALVAALGDQARREQDGADRRSAR